MLLTTSPCGLGNVPPPKDPKHKLEWEIVAEQKLLERENSIRPWDEIWGKRTLPSSTDVRRWPLECGELSTKDILITESTPSALLRRLTYGEWTAEETLRAFIRRAVIAHHLTNPLTEVFFNQGIERAKELDAYFRAHRRPIGPFHGLPISLKDTMEMKNIDTTGGYVAWVGKQPERNDTLVDLLWQGGAVFYCKTNVPQTLMSGECFNFLFGRTTSPCNTTTSAGGSSGGEGSLVALGGSPVGVGTDIAGSINTPANHNGIYGLCPSTGRIPIHGPHNAFETKVISGVSGPLSRSVDGLQVFTKGVLELSPWEVDATCLRIPWDQKEYERAQGIKEPLCFGFIPNDGVVTPHPPIQRGMNETMDALRAAGHRVINLPSFLETVDDRFEDKIVRILGSSGNRHIQSILSKYNEPLSSEIVLPEASDELNTPEYMQAAKEILILRQKYMDKWKQTADVSPTGRPVDVFILPSGGHVAPPHGTMGYLLYECISNMLDWTCATIPVGFVDPVLDELAPGEQIQFLSQEDRKNWIDYSPKKYENVPVCLQVLGQRHTEERVLGCLRAIDRALGRNAFSEPY